MSNTTQKKILTLSNKYFAEMSIRDLNVVASTKLINEVLEAFNNTHDTLERRELYVDIRDFTGFIMNRVRIFYSQSHVFSITSTVMTNRAHTSSDDIYTLQIKMKPNELSRTLFDILTNAFTVIGNII